MPGQYAWTRDVDTGEAEKILRGWLRGEIPSLEDWTKMEWSGRPASQRSVRGRMVSDVRDAIECFSKAYHHRELDVSGFLEIQVRVDAFDVF